MKQNLSDFDISTELTGQERTDLIVKFVNKFVKFKKIYQIYSEHIDKEGNKLLDAFFRELNLVIDYNIDEFRRKIPSKGAFITVSNYPIGGLEPLLLYRIISEIRPDYKLVTNYFFHTQPIFKDITIPINEVVSSFRITMSKAGIKRVLDYLKEGNAVGFFPAMRSATFKPRYTNVSDVRWKAKIMKLIKIANVPVVPLFIQNNNRLIYHILGIIHPIFQTFLLQKEIVNKKNTHIKIEIGEKISPKVLSEFKDFSDMTIYLRTLVYALNFKISDKNNLFTQKIGKVEPIIPPIDKKLLEQEIENAKELGYLLFSNENFDLFVIPPEIIPNLLKEIGRLREITFREVGEGTNKSIDIDEFDLYYHHLVIWDRTKKQIVGSYRFGRGAEIMNQFGVKGFYVHTLFKLKKGLYPILEKTLELGRSFIVKEYQRKPLSLFMLWKGILYYLLKNPSYRYLMGPVSISGTFSDYSKMLIKAFFEKYHFNRELAQYVTPRNKFKPKLKNVDINTVLEKLNGNINELDKYIKDIEKGKRLPVLFKKYMSLNAKTLAFNVDPDFNYCLDGLMILDVMDVPIETVKGLAKELNDQKLLDLYNFGD